MCLQVYPKFVLRHSDLLRGYDNKKDIHSIRLSFSNSLTSHSSLTVTPSVGEMKFLIGGSGKGEGHVKRSEFVLPVLY